MLLLTAATGAWAQSNGTYSDLRDQIGSGGDVKLSRCYYKYIDGDGDYIEITTSGVIDCNGAIIDMEDASISLVFKVTADNVTIKNLSIINYTGTGDAIQFTGTGGSMVNVVYAVAVSPGTSANTWTLSMPSGNVLLTPQYAAVAKWAVESAGTTDEKTLLPVAAEGVIAGTTAPLIAEGTGIVAFAGTSTEDKQGTVMYAVTPATATEAPVIGSSDWKDAVPTAKDIADGGAEVKVWYYIQGADAPDGEDATLDNTFNNSDVCTQPIEVSVLTNKFTLTLDPAPVEKVTVTIDGTPDPATPDANGKIANIKMGSEVKIKANTGYKLRKVEVKKTLPDTKYLKWDEGQKKLVATEIPATATKVENANGNVYWPEGTYLVEGDVTIGGTIELTGDVELIIKDGAKLSAEEIYGAVNKCLSVYGQTNMNGELNVAGSFIAIASMSELNIHSCKVNARNSCEDSGGIESIVFVNVYGGSVYAEYTGDSNGFGISSDIMKIYGGEVKAVGKGNDNSNSYGIRNVGDFSSTVTVYGGKLWAECAGNLGINTSKVTLKKDSGYTSGKIETCSDGTSWTVYSGTGTPDAKYVRVGY